MKHLRRFTLAALALGAAAALGGCAARAGYATSGAVYAEKPGYYGPATMVPVRENVWVVEGHTYPVFYSGGAYWRYGDGVWYRSRYADDGFVRVQSRVVPRPVLQVERPGRYVRYRAPVRTRVRAVPPTHLQFRGEVRGTYDDRDRVRARQPRDDRRRQRRR